MSYIVPMDKPNCFNCHFRTGDYCGILTENEKVKEYAERYDTSEFCPLVDASKENDINPCDECERDCHMCGITLENER